MPDVNRQAPEKTHTESVIFSKQEWTKEESKEWLEKHDFYTDGYDENETQHRWRQYNPDSEKFRYRTQKITSDGKEIILIIGYLKSQEQEGESQMKRLEIRGVIVPADYDVDIFEKYIELGVITPESRIRKQLETIKEPIELYIHSPGGSVWAAYEVVNAITDWQAKTGQKVIVTLGGLVASAGAAIAYMVQSEKIQAHRNSKVMFHGAWTETIGGTNIHTATAEVLEKINNDIKQILFKRTGLTQNEVNEWFQDGSEKWLSASELLEYHLADCVINEDIALDIPKFDIAGFGEKGLAIAAFYPSEEKQTPNNDWQNGYEAGRIDAQKEYLEVIEKLNEKIAKRDELIRKMQSEKDALTSQHEKQVAELKRQISVVTNQNKELSNRLDKLALKALQHVPEANTWEDALRACGGDYVKARKQYPDIFYQFVSQKK